MRTSTSDTAAQVAAACHILEFAAPPDTSPCPFVPQAPSRWPTRAQTQTAPSSSSAPPTPPFSTASTACLERRGRLSKLVARRHRPGPPPDGSPPPPPARRRPSQVTSGMDVVKRIEKEGSQSGATRRGVTLGGGMYACGAQPRRHGRRAQRPAPKAATRARAGSTLCECPWSMRAWHHPQHDIRFTISSCVRHNTKPECPWNSRRISV